MRSPSTVEVALRDLDALERAARAAGEVAAAFGLTAGVTLASLILGRWDAVGCGVLALYCLSRAFTRVRALGPDPRQFVRGGMASTAPSAGSRR